MEISSVPLIGKGDFSQMDFSAQQTVKYEEKKTKIGKQQKLIQYNETKAGQIMVSYIFLVTYMFNSITSSSSSSSVLRQCQWVFFSQIISISAIFWIAITEVIIRLLRMKYHYEQSLIEQEMMVKAMNQLQSGQNKSGEQQQKQQIRGGQLVQPDRVTQRRWYTYAFAIVSPLIAFSVVTLYACVRILRDPK